MKKRYTYIYSLFLLINIFLSTFPLYAQDSYSPAIEMLSSISTMETHIGQHINYKITIKSLKNIRYGFNEVKFEYISDEFAIISSDIATVEDGEYTQTTYDYRIAFYNHGIYNMPNCYIEYFWDNNSTVISNTPLYISIKPFSDGEYLPPIENNQSITFPWLIFTIVVLLLALLIALIKIILYIVKKRKNRESTIIIEPEDVEALRELRELEIKITWKEISFTEYYFELTQIFRKYLTTRFDLPILEMTTSDIKRHISPKILPSYEAILDFLNYSDFIKFSKLEVNVKNSISNMRFCELYIKEHGSKEALKGISQNNSGKQINKNKRKKHHENKRTHKTGNF